MIFCDSQSALKSMNSPSGSMSKVVCDIKRNVITANENNSRIEFVWIPSHVGIRYHDRADRLANEACKKENVDRDLGLSIAVLKNIQVRIMNSDLEELRNAERPDSCSISKYDKFCDKRYRYGQH